MRRDHEKMDETGESTLKIEDWGEDCGKTPLA
jgi:hypothetical protein